MATKEEPKNYFTIIPRELRDNIYKYLFVFDKPIQVQLIHPSPEEPWITSYNEYGQLVVHLKFYHQQTLLQYVSDEEAPNYPCHYNADEGGTHAKALAAQAKELSTIARTSLFNHANVFVYPKVAETSQPSLTALSLCSRLLYSETPTERLYALNILDFGTRYLTMHTFLNFLHDYRPTAIDALKLRFQLRFGDPIENPTDDEAKFLLGSLALLMRWGPKGWDKKHCFADVKPVLRLRFAREDLQQHPLQHGWEFEWAEAAFAEINIKVKFLEKGSGKGLVQVRREMLAGGGVNAEVGSEDKEVLHLGDERGACLDAAGLEGFFPFTWSKLDMKLESDEDLRANPNGCAEHCACSK